jgi:lipopolysaccharide transport system permease protein
MISSRTFDTHREIWREQMALLIQQRRIIVEMAKREITDRYLGQVFGVFWAFGHPLVLMAVYVFIFAVVLKVKVGGTHAMPLDYTTYLLAGLIPWFGFQESMGKGSTVIIAHADLVKQVIFPIEVLPVKGVLASLITQIIFLFLLLLYIVVMYHSLSWICLLLPFLVLVQALAMIGVAYGVSAIGVYFRDIKDFLQVFSIVGIYLMPTFYLPESVPTLFRPLLYANPFSYLVWCYQDVLYFGRFEHWWAWVVWTVISVGLFYLGYRLFRRLKIMFGTVL